MKKIILFLAIVLVMVSVAYAAEDFSAAKSLIDSKVGCENLTQDQLEQIGDYYMEQMHPGPAHEYMDQMMGGEGSESLKEMYLSMAERFYCGGNSSAYTACGGMTDDGAGCGMMGNYRGGKMAYRMMGYGDGYGMMGYGGLSWLLCAVLVVLGIFIFSVIFWLTYNWLVKEKRKR